MVTANNGQSVDGKPTFIRETDPSPTDLPETVIDKYAKWASTVTDAPTQYHRATGAVILSTICSPYVSMDTSFGTIRPNIWLMILAGTTVTRKSTSMNLAVKMLNDVLDDYLLATDGSPEGLFSELANRSGQVSLFHRDEITGFVSAIASKDYLSGTLESFTHLYDGTEQKRVLRGQSIVVKDPLFIFLCGGIKTKMEEIVGMEHIRSGFLPRFLFVVGQTTKDQLRPIGPPRAEEKRTDGTSPRDDVLNEFWRINKYYTTPPDPVTPLSVKIGGIPKPAPPPNSPTTKHVNMEGTDEAWTRIQQMHEDAMEMGDRSSAPELYSPLFARLADSVLKVAILLAAADLKGRLELHHVQNAIRLSQEWMDGLIDFAGKIEAQPEMDRWERKLDKIVNFVKAKHPNPVSRTEVAQKFRIRKNDIVNIEGTLTERRLLDIVREKIQGNARNSGDGYKYWYQMPSGTVLDAYGRDARTAIQREDSYRASNPGNSQEDYDKRNPEAPTNRKRRLTPKRDYQRKRQDDND